MSTQTHTQAFAAPDITASGLKPLIGLSLDNLQQESESLSLPKFRAKQLYEWIYQKGVTSFEAMTNLPQDLREQLEKTYTLERPEIITYQQSQDGTEKWLLRMADGQDVEMVFIPEENRGTLCVSSQVGCTLTCQFCHTGTQPLVRNLGAREIVQQVMLARDHLGDWESGAQMEKRRLTNIVFMGMGEPLYNYENVALAVKLLTDHEGLAFSKRKIMISTSGVVPLIEKCGEELGTGLAISLHAVTDELRNRLIPLNKKYPLRTLLEACRNYPGASTMRRITFEYVMLQGVNDSIQDAKGLVQLLAGIPSKVNLIPFNPWPGSGFETSDDKTIDAFADVLVKAGYISPIRRPRGQDILAACGQLKSESQRVKKH